MKNLILTVVIFLLSINLVQAKYVQTCDVKYMTKDGWSKKYTVDVTFISGSELNEATSSFKYSSFSVYAVIFWSKEQVTVIKLSSFLSCGDTVDKSCITNSVTDLKGKDQDDDEWKICVGDYCY